MDQINTCSRSHLENDMVLSVGGQKPDIFPSLGKCVWILDVLCSYTLAHTLPTVIDPNKQSRVTDTCVTDPQH